MSFFEALTDKKRRRGFLTKHIVLIYLCMLVSFSVFVYGYRFIHAPQLGISNDDAQYVVLAESFATGQPYRVVSYPDAPLETTWPPGYPLLILAPVWLISGNNHELLRGTSLLLSVANVLLFYRVLCHMTQRRSILFSVTALFALNSWVSGYAGMCRAEPAFIFFCLLHMLTIQSWDSIEKCNKWLPFGVAGLTLGAVILVRYQGIALAIASGIYLLLKKSWRQAGGLALATILFLLPFGGFLLINGLDTPDSLFAVSVLARFKQLPQNLPTMLANYYRATSNVVFPALGPRVESTLAPYGLVFLIHVAHLFIILPIVGGLIFIGLRNKQLPAIYLVTYFVLIMGITNPDYGVIHDEPRYIVAVLPFIYFYFVNGLQAIFERFPVSTFGRRFFKHIPYGVITAMLLLLIWRNYQQAHVIFPVVNLESGARWVQQNTSDGSIIMTHDPVSRYIYLRRNTIDYPYQNTSDEFLQTIREQGVDYLIVSPPLTLDGVANTERLLHPYVRDIVLPLLHEEHENFDLVYQDEPQQIWIYKWSGLQ